MFKFSRSINEIKGLIPSDISINERSKKIQALLFGMFMGYRILGKDLQERSVVNSARRQQGLLPNI